VRAVLLALALALPTGAMAQDPAEQVRFSPGYAWFDGPGFTEGGEGRIRVVPFADRGQAALTLNQFYEYQLIYRRELARLSLRMPIRQAQAHAHRTAWLSVVRANQARTVRELDLEPLRAGALPLDYVPFD
jgi:hypothetical protein